ncbi:ComEC/Rec2 family competence protein [Bacillus sp. FJAT-44742]|uniref:ComEC/Rec2 family competence protein n=1 Tax=Bacillus sp. FJAT-44742 TaxID=2014005 RepID=UPI000C250576|nr:hypothetical protein [Bacillus sp. FJAT-44742]
MRDVLLYVCLFCFLQLGLTGCQESYPASTEASPALEMDIHLEADEFLITFMDLPDGEATLLQSGAGENVLINTGGQRSRPKLEESLQAFDVYAIDALVLTNEDEAYTANTDWLSAQYGIDTIIGSRKSSEMIADRFPALSSKVIYWEEGKVNFPASGMETEVLFAGEDEEGALVLKFSYGRESLLYMGTAKEEVEEALTDHPRIKSTFLKVGDFGSHFGANLMFLDHVDPQIAIVFLLGGDRADKGLLERLNDAWIDVYQTGKHGTISFKWNKEKNEWFTLISRK